MVEILLSLKPKWWAKIASGEKTVEIRKTVPHAGMPFKVFVYETKFQDRGAIVGEFMVRRFWCNYLSKDGGESCLHDSEIRRYAAGKEYYGWEISDVKVYKVPSVLQEFGLDRPPQSWQYLSGGDRS